MLHEQKPLRSINWNEKLELSCSLEEKVANVFRMFGNSFMSEEEFVREHEIFNIQLTKMRRRTSLFFDRIFGFANIIFPIFFRESYFGHLSCGPILTTKNDSIEFNRNGHVNCKQQKQENDNKNPKVAELIIRNRTVHFRKQFNDSTYVMEKRRKVE